MNQVVAGIGAAGAEVPRSRTMREVVQTAVNSGPPGLLRRRGSRRSIFFEEAHFAELGAE